MKSFNIVMRKDCLRMKRIGMLTSGGDCQALNAAMRGVVKGLSENVDELEIYGFHNGYKGLIYGDYRLLTSADFSGILTKGGTILGSSRQPFKQMRVPDENGLDKVEAMKQRADGSNPTVLFLRAASSNVKAKGSDGNVCGEMLADLGCVNIADSDESLLDDLSMEAIIAADPQYIFVTIQGNDSDAAMKNVEDLLTSNPAWASLTAVKNDHYYILDKRLFNLKPNAKWGEAYKQLADILYPEAE